MKRVLLFATHWFLYIANVSQIAFPVTFHCPLGREVDGPQENLCVVIHCPMKGIDASTCSTFKWQASNQSRCPSHIFTVMEKAGYFQHGWSRSRQILAIARGWLPKVELPWLMGWLLIKASKGNRMLLQYLTPNSNCSDPGLKKGQSIRSYKTASRPHTAPWMTVYIEELQDTTW